MKFNPISKLLSIINKNDEADTDFIIASYLLNHLSELKHISIYTVADECYVSRSSVQRFVKNIGFESFTAFKEISVEGIRHQSSFISYTDHTDYENYIMNQIGLMMHQITHMAEEQNLLHLAQKIHDSENVILVTSEDTSAAVRSFQQTMLAMNKMLRLVTSATNSLELLSGLTEKDLIISCSASGNFALAINPEIEQLNAYKALITLNHTTSFENIYQYIFYLSDDQQNNSRMHVAVSNVYTRYGLTFFFDLLYHIYFTTYQKELSI